MNTSPTMLVATPARVMLGTVLLGCFIITSAIAQPVAESRGRYTMTPAEGGFMRLDTESGAVSLCTHKADTWACEPVNDKTNSSAGEARLETENKNLKDRIKVLEERLSQRDAQANGNPPVDAPGGVSKLPSEKEVDEALDYVERLYKKFRDRIQKLDPPPSVPAPKSGDSGSGAL